MLHTYIISISHSPSFSLVQRRWNPPTFTKCGSCLPWSSWKKTFRPVDDWRRPWISLVSWGCASWCTRTPWC